MTPESSQSTSGVVPEPVPGASAPETPGQGFDTALDILLQHVAANLKTLDKLNALLG